MFLSRFFVYPKRFLFTFEIQKIYKMYQFLQKAHSGWAYIALLLLLLAVVVSILGFVSKKEFTTTNRKIALFALISCHIQLLVGLILYFVSPLGFAMLGEMKDKALRLTSLEHPLINIIALVLITIGWSKHKKLVDGIAKHKTFAIYYGLGLLLILSRIPWSLWF